MGYPDHRLVQFGGYLGSEDLEHWSCGIRMVKSGLGAMDDEQYLDDTAVPAISAWMHRENSHIGGAAHLTFVKCNQIDEFGLYLSPIVHGRVLDIAGDAHISTMPYQACVVLTWHTNDGSSGLATKGRIYSPLPSVEVDQSSGFFPTGYAALMADSARQLLDNLDAPLGGGLGGTIRPHIVSRGKKTGSAWGPGISHQIDYVTVDNRIDIQRRRANQMAGVKSRADIEY